MFKRNSKEEVEIEEERNCEEEKEEEEEKEKDEEEVKVEEDSKRRGAIVLDKEEFYRDAVWVSFLQEAKQLRTF